MRRILDHCDKCGGEKYAGGPMIHRPWCARLDKMQIAIETLQKEVQELKQKLESKVKIEDSLLTTKDVASLLEVSRDNVCGKIKSGVIQARRTSSGDSGRYLMERSHIKQLIEKGVLKLMSLWTNDQVYVAARSKAEAMRMYREALEEGKIGDVEGVEEALASSSKFSKLHRLLWVKMGVGHESINKDEIETKTAEEWLKCRGTAGPGFLGEVYLG